jgi:hypothetical protein
MICVSLNFNFSALHFIFSYALNCKWCVLSQLCANVVTDKPLSNLWCANRKQCIIRLMPNHRSARTNHIYIFLWLSKDLIKEAESTYMTLWLLSMSYIIIMQSATEDFQVPSKLQRERPQKSTTGLSIYHSIPNSPKSLLFDLWWKQNIKVWTEIPVEISTEFYSIAGKFPCGNKRKYGKRAEQEPHFPCVFLIQSKTWQQSSSLRNTLFSER